MATQLFLETMQELAKDYTEYRKETLNVLNEGEGKHIEFNFKDYVSQYYTFLETQFEEELELPEEDSDDDEE